MHEAMCWRHMSRPCVSCHLAGRSPGLGKAVCVSAVCTVLSAVYCIVHSHKRRCREQMRAGKKEWEGGCVCRRCESVCVRADGGDVTGRAYECL